MYINRLVLLSSLMLLLPVFVQAGSLPDFVPLIEQNKNAVVNISTTRDVSPRQNPFTNQLPHGVPEGPWGDLLQRFFEGIDPEQLQPRQRQRNSLGSGFIISADGYVITNNHVVADADEIIVRLSDRNEYEAVLVGKDAMSDIALLKIDAKNLPVVRTGNSDKLRVGEWVVAIGSPFGFDHSVTSGIVSAKGRALPSENYVPFIQTDVAINPGNSGGPLFNLDGEVIGVNAQIYSRTGGFMGLSFAIPIDVALEVVEQLKGNGYVSRGWLGVYIQEITRELADSFGMKTLRGALISQVQPGGPADKGGLQSGDVVLEFNGKPIEYSSALAPLVGRVPAGETARIRILREGKSKVLSLKIGELPQNEQLASATRGSSTSPAAENTLGMLLIAPDADQQKAYNLEGAYGVAIQAIKPGAAFDAGIRRGDVITRVNNQPVRGVEHFKEIIHAAKPGSRIALLVQRRQGPVYLALRIPK